MVNTEQNKLDDFHWFLENYQQLFEEYGDSYLVIKNKKILGSYDSVGESIKETEKNEPQGSFIVQHCNGDESGYTNYITSMNFMGVRG